jgi:hypothetical protein
MIHRVLLAGLALLAPGVVLAQETALPPPPTLETSQPETSLVKPAPTPPPVERYVEDLKKQLGAAPTAKAAAPAEKEKGALSIQRDLLWEEDYDDFRRKQALKPRRELLSGGVADVHVVQPGDTLWDLSARYVGSHWLWPRVWSYNPHITNPHWIYPGQVIRFQAASAKPAQPEVAGTTEVPKKPTVIPAQAGLVVFRHSSFVTKEELKALGTLENSKEDHRLLSRFEEVYLRFAKPQGIRIGDRFLTVRVGREVVHPSTGEKIGNIVHVTGEVRITALGDEKKFYTAVVGRSWRSVERENRLLPWEDMNTRVERRPNKKNLRGYVIASVQERILGEHQLAFVDLGAKHGVEYGNRFSVLRRGDGYQRLAEYEDKLPQMPLEEIGEIIVLAVRPETCVGLLRRTSLEVEVGDKVEMRQGE